MIDTIRKIKGYDVTLLKHSNIGEYWFTAYVKLKGKLKRSLYCNETYRSRGNILGVDTNHVHNFMEGDVFNRKDCLKQITELIIEHNEFKKNGIK